MLLGIMSHSGLCCLGLCRIQYCVVLDSVFGVDVAGVYVIRDYVVRYTVGVSFLVPTYCVKIQPQVSE